tara:strand:- start:1363 stop:1650 length:288 start_codon:yes stop_codon:yes gene_type:complete
MRTKLVNGEVIELTAEENAQRDLEEQAWADGAFDRAINQLRTERNAKLAETDFYALSDLTLSDEMQTYRQELRDITQDLATESDVNSVVWPTKPN